MTRTATIARCLFLVPIAFAMLLSCKTTKYIPAGDALYTGATISIKAPDLTRRNRKELAENLKAITRPKANRKVLGIPFKLMIYNLAGDNDTTRKHWATRWLKKWGEPPVLLSDLRLGYNVKLQQSTLENRGFFAAAVTGDTTVKKKTASAIYTVQTGPQYTINEVHFENDSSDILRSQVYYSSYKTLLKPGNPFDLDIIKLERIRIDAHLKENGFYYFAPEYIIVQVDSTIGSHKVNLYVRAKPAIPHEATRLLTINEVYIFPNYWISTIAPDTSKSNAELYKGYYVVDKRQRYKPKMFQQAMQFKKGDVYSRQAHNNSINRLVNMGLFKFVKNRFEPADSAIDRLNTFYYLTPFPKKSLQAEFTGNTKSNNLTGTSVTIGWRDRNLFRGGEQLFINASVGTEVQYNGALQGYNTFRVGGEANLTFPRFLVPFFNFNTRGGFLPKTKIQLGYDILNKSKLYTMNSFRASYGYIWKETLMKEHELNPISITYVQPLLVTTRYLDSAKNNSTLQKAIEKQFILGTNYNFNYNELTGNRPMSGLYFNGNVDLSGNIAGLVSGANIKSGNPKYIFQAQFSQYLRFENELREYIKVSPTAVWANRIIAGVGIPYGNSLELPFIKQFFIGGNNSIRAFRSRSVGPGTYFAPASRDFFPDQSGDIKLELNTEFRQQLAGIVYGALFVDAGNIWLFNKNIEKPGAEFTKDFYKQLAVGTGIGLRFDISFLVLRLDVAIPLRKPWLPENQWVIDQIKFNNSSWRKDNIIFNLGIGYPF